MARTHFFKRHAHQSGQQQRIHLRFAPQNFAHDRQRQRHHFAFHVGENRSRVPAQNSRSASAIAISLRADGGFAFRMRLREPFAKALVREVRFSRAADTPASEASAADAKAWSAPAKPDLSRSSSRAASFHPGAGE